MKNEQQLDVFTIDDDAKSLEDDGNAIDEDEVEQRAVVDFVSSMELDGASMKLRGDDREDDEETENKNSEEGHAKNDDEVSQQYSLDDVSDDDEGD